MASRFCPPRVIVVPLAFLMGMVVVWALATRPTTRASESSAPPDLLARSESILRGVEGDSALRLEITDGVRLAGGGKAGEWLQVDGENSSGQHVGSVLWERSTGHLLQVIHRPRAAATEGSEMTQARGARLARFWLQRIGALGQGEPVVSVTSLLPTNQRHAYRVRWRGRSADVALYRQNGDLASVDFTWPDQKMH